jgi:hypothetical protein
VRPDAIDLPTPVAHNHSRRRPVPSPEVSLGAALLLADQRRYAAAG